MDPLSEEEGPTEDLATSLRGARASGTLLELAFSPPQTIPFRLLILTLVAGAELGLTGSQADASDEATRFGARYE